MFVLWSIIVLSCLCVSYSFVGHKFNLRHFVTDKSSTSSANYFAQSLPWDISIKESRELTYMPMLNSALDVLKGLGMEEVAIDKKFVFQESSVKPARIGNVCFRNDKFRKVRLTYFDAGDGVQVFNCLFYPSFEYDIPLLGVDLISLGLNRVLSVIDFQPLHPTEEYSSKYISDLENIRIKYPDLQGTLSGKIYDDTSFFSKQMLFGRFTDESKVKSVVFPAFREYLMAYINLMDSAVPSNKIEDVKIVQERQMAYDKYSAEKDPAVGLFDAYFGKEWSKSFVHDYLFTLSTAPAGEISPVHKFQVAPTTLAPAVVSASIVPKPLHAFEPTITAKSLQSPSSPIEILQILSLRTMKNNQLVTMRLNTEYGYP